MEDNMEFKNGYALIIGVSEYKNDEDDNLKVEAIANDTEGIFNVLVDTDFGAYKEEHVKRLVNGDATKDNILVNLEELYQKTLKANNATVLIFLAGHGYLNIEKNKDKKKFKQYYFLPHDTKVNIREGAKSKGLLAVDSVDVNTGISGTVLMEKFSKLSDSTSVKRLVIFCHTCHSGSLGTSLSVEKPVQSLFKPIPVTTFDELTKNVGRCIVSSSRQQQESWIEIGSKYSIFGKQLIAGLKGEGSSANDTVVRIFDLCSFLSNTVEYEAKKIMGKDQVPVFTLYRSDNFSIARKSGGENNFCLKVHLFLVRYLSMDELKVLSMIFRVPVEQMPDTDISSLALELIRQATKSGGLRALVRILRQNKSEGLERLPPDRFSPGINKELDQYQQMVEDNIKAIKIAEFRKNLEDWLLEKDLRDSKPYDPIRKIATNKTHEILKSLNSIGKSEVIRILYDYELIGAKRPISLRGVDLTGVSLNNYDFTEIDLNGAVLNSANLSRTKLIGADLTKAKLNEAELGGVQMQDAILRECEMENTNLNGANLTKATLKKATLKGADLNNADLTQADLSEAILTKAKLQGFGTKLIKTNFSKANFDNADLTGADIFQIKLNEASMVGTKLEDKWDLIRRLLNRDKSISEERIDLDGADLSNANLNDMKFQGQNLRDVTFHNSSLLRADFRGANLVKTDFQNAALISVNLVSILFNSAKIFFYNIFGRNKDRQFMLTNIWGSNQADFTGAILRQVNMEGAKVSPKQLLNAKEIKNTKMPGDTEPWSFPLVPGPRAIKRPG